jgi:hypothetical protein
MNIAGLTPPGLDVASGRFRVVLRKAPVLVPGGPS